jgi:hypothetical protein
MQPRKKQKTDNEGGGEGGQGGDIDDRFWLLCVMISNGHDSFPFVGWREPRLKNRVVFINLLRKPLNMLKSGDRLTMMRLSLNYTAIRGLPLRRVALQLMQDPAVNIPPNYIRGSDSIKLKLLEAPREERQLLTLKVDFAKRLSIREPASEDQVTHALLLGPSPPSLSLRSS